MAEAHALRNGVEFYKETKDSKVWWVEYPHEIGTMEFSFDMETVFNLFRDYPHNLTPEQKEIFDKENPYWAGFFRDRSIGGDYD